MSYARMVAEQIMNEADSGSGAWDELGGPTAVLTESGDGQEQYVITMAGGYDETGDPYGETVTITVTEVRRGAP